MSILGYKRQWLNPSGSDATGYIYWGVRQEDFGGYYAMFKLADCSRIVSLDIYLGSKRERRVSLKKLNLIKKAVDDMIAQVEYIDNKEEK